MRGRCFENGRNFNHGAVHFWILYHSEAVELQSAHGPIMPEDSIPNSRMAVTKVPLRFESCDVEESQIVLDVSYMFRSPLPPLES